METGLISPRTKRCLLAFQGLQHTSAASKSQEHLLTVVIKESSERFAIWASNLGASHEPSDHKSADYRLREAWSLAKLIAQNLDDLLDVLENATDIANGSRPDASLLEEARMLDHPEDEEDIPETEDSEFGELCLMTSDIVTYLLKVSILIRQSSDRDRYAKAAASRDPPFMRDVDIQRIGERFPKIKDRRTSSVDEHAWLRERLGNANAQRRQYLRYVRDHYNRLASAPSDSQASGLLSAANQPASAPAPKPPSQVPSLRPTLAPTDSSTVNVSKVPENISNQVLEQQDDADEALSLVSSQDLAETEDADTKHRVESLNTVSNGRLQFECPYCRGIVQPGTHSKWKKHVFSDLRAYVCTFKDCCAGLFEDRRSWFQHELENHRRHYVCQLCSRSYNTSADLTEHLRGAHSSRIPPLPEMMDSMVAASSRPVAAIRPSECPLCDEWYVQLRGRADHEGVDTQQAIAVSLDEFRRHLSEHLEQIALFVIPPRLDAQSISGDSHNGKDTVSISRWQEAGNFDDEWDDEWALKCDELYEASSLGDERRVLALLEQVSDVNAYSNALQAASAGGHVEVVQALLEAGADVNAQGGHGSALYGASQGGHANVVQELLVAGADVNAEGGQYGSALQAASQQGHEKVVEILLNKGADVNAQGGRYSNALQAATQRGHKKIVEVLLRKGADVNAQGGYGSALQAASQGGHEKIVQMLIEAGADIGFQRGESTSEDMLQLRRSRLGADHPDTLRSMDNLAIRYADTGRLNDALELSEEVLQMRKSILGADHHDTLQSMDNLAVRYADTGRLNDAMKLSEEITQLRRRKLGSHHPDTLQSMDNLAVRYADTGRLNDAMKLSEEITQLRRRKLGSHHPDTLQSMDNLAVRYADTGRLNDALELNETVLQMMKDELGAAQPITLQSMSNLAIRYSEAGRRHEALELSEELLQLRKSSQGAVHPDTLELFEKVLQLRKSCEQSGSGPPDTRYSMNTLTVPPDSRR